MARPRCKPENSPLSSSSATPPPLTLSSPCPPSEPILSDRLPVFFYLVYGRRYLKPKKGPLNLARFGLVMDFMEQGMSPD